MTAPLALADGDETTGSDGGMDIGMAGGGDDIMPIIIGDEVGTGGGIDMGTGGGSDEARAPNDRIEGGGVTGDRGDDAKMSTNDAAEEVGVG